MNGFVVFESLYLCPVLVCSSIVIIIHNYSHKYIISMILISIGHLPVKSSFYQVSINFYKIMFKLVDKILIAVVLATQSMVCCENTTVELCISCDLR